MTAAPNYVQTNSTLYYNINSSTNTLNITQLHELQDATFKKSMEEKYLVVEQDGDTQAKEPKIVYTVR